MNTNQLKKFAQEARRKLLEQVGAKLAFVLTTDSAELREKTEQVKQLREELNRTTKEQLVEKVAYTWFNRLMALRFMDTNDYQPLGIRVITPKDGYTTPELLDEAKRGNIPDDLKLKRQKVYDILDNRIPSTNPQNEAYKELLIAVCNHLHTNFPFLFERINDYTELLLPDDLTSDFSFVTDIRIGMPVDDCKNVEIIGWLYQFYISEEKDRLINAKKRYKAHEIAPVTQLFTPKWIVQYMVDNTLGQFWKEARPKTNILKDLEFYIIPENEDIIPRRTVKSPEEITFFDPCVGSAHILCYAFDIFYKIYQEEGYNESDIPELIITKNLFGIDIDERAAQLAGFALMMKGRQYNKRLLKKGITPNIVTFQNTKSHPKFKNAQTFGSLIKISEEEYDNIKIEENSIFTEEHKQIKKQASYLVNTYDILVTNPPYMNSSNMEVELKQFIELEYQSTKSDLFACFLFQATKLTKDSGLIGFISPYVWMFITSYEKIREHIIAATTISSLIQLEYNAFEPACVPVATFIIRNKYHSDYKGNYIRLAEFTGHENQAPKVLEAIKNNNCGWFYVTDQKVYSILPSNRIAYWLPPIIESMYLREENKLVDWGTQKNRITTGNNERFLRQWSEVQLNKMFKPNKWIPFSKGGGYRRYFGLNNLVFNYANNGKEIKDFNGYQGGDEQYYYAKCLTWSSLTSSKISFRYLNEGFICSAKGPQFVLNNDSDEYLLLAFLNSNVCQYYLTFLSATLDYNWGDIAHIHVLKKIKELPIEDLSISNVKVSITDWDSHEISWNFRKNDLFNKMDKEPVELQEILDLYYQYWKTKFYQVHQNEEKINHQLIELYGFKEKLTSIVPLEDITILQEELDRKELAKLNKKLVRNSETEAVQNYHEITLPLMLKEVIAQFISYSVGCIFGRYSLDKEGLILANQGETLQDYLQKITNSKNECTFLPDEDNIIPILNEEWFEDDIVGRFNQFLKVSFGERNFNKNIEFIEEQIGKNIRKYFIKDFYPDHIKRYKKRPIYWMFSSSKGSFNVLIYMHRYTQDTVSNILNKYLKEFIGKLKTRKENLQHIQVTGSPAEKTKAIKESDGIDKILIELQEYERDFLFPLATERIAINLDDGVLVNYNKFGKAVKEVTGLNDIATKKKVRGFDWIDTSQIR